ncbi:Anaerobic dehydrogenase [Rhodovulum sp. PH10]|uniref:molybdopterin-containing oxidoreductase family protein n=1 Tax=Rhodovulum sp. PH10 TaxID=1187851 RepID=UPI00027C2E62|nr:molybdopterin-dependent oxidoreductase [Rhodovulum sp. PH10]EJW09886.1 Anaerobic dehydrogenase [Rhodovulum sp. PH10]
MPVHGTCRTICGLCHANCGLLVTVGPHGIERIEGDPDHPASRGYICGKAHAGKEIVESPQRLTMPLRRTPRGLEPIGWDDALDFAAGRLAAIRDRYGPESLVRNAGAPVSYEARDGFLYFMRVFGSPNFTGSSNCCWLPRATAFNATMGGKPEPDFENARLILFWGSNPLATERYGNYCGYERFHRIISRAKARGARLIAIDPVRSETAARCDEWIRIEPGSDVALGLAMINVIIAENLHDRDFVDRYTSGFLALAEHVRTATPDWAACITGLAADQIVDLARRFATNGPATICDGNGFDMYCSVVDAVRTVAILLGLTGNVDVPGSVVFLPFAKQSVLSAPPKTAKIRQSEFPIFRDVPFPGIKEALLHDEPYRPRAMIVHHSNPVLIQANQRRTVEAFRKLEFLVVDDVFMTATAEIADLVLPATSPMERYGYRAYSSFDRGFVALSRPVVGPPGEARDVFTMEYELAARMGLEADYPFVDSRSWVEHMLKPTGVTLARLEHEQIVAVTPPPRYRKYKETGFQTPSGKLEFYSEQFAKAGYDPLPIYREPTNGGASPVVPAPAGFPLRCTSRRPAVFVHTKFRNLAGMIASYPEPLLWIEPSDAARRGLREGDMVELSSPRGRVTIRTRFDISLRPGLVMMDFGWGNPTDGLASANELTSDEFWNPISGSTPQRLFACEVVKMT